MRQPDPSAEAEPERGFVVGVLPKGVDGESELAELRELARTAGVAPVGELVQHRAHPDPRTFVGKGKLTELKEAYAGSEAEVLLVDEELSPTQQRSLEDALKARVVDRTQLILDIFAQHARTAEGKLQVELAQLEYNLPRMRGMWQHLERLGGGVGTRGPGESRSRATAASREPESRSSSVASAASRAGARPGARSVSGRALRPSRWPATRTSVSRRS